LGGNKFEAVNDPLIRQFEFVGAVPEGVLKSLDQEASTDGFTIQDGGDELGLNEDVAAAKEEKDQFSLGTDFDGMEDQDFPVTEQ
jgi:hypothetical protein